jgi:hypothetical protein
MANPLIPQGTLNRLNASVIWTNFPSLNVTSGFLMPNGITIAFEGVTTDFIRTMTGVVTSPEPYQMVTMTINLLKTQQLANLYEQQRQSNSLLGPCTVRPDANPLQPYNFLNMAIENVAGLDFSGTTPIFPVSCKGYMPINSSAFG